MSMRRILQATAVIVFCAASPGGLALAGGGTITVKGSDTMVILGQRWAEEYMKERKDVTIQVTGGGSGTGIAALLNGTTTLANSSRPIKAEEKEAAKKNGIDVVEIKTAMDALAVVVNAGNPVEHLTMKQVGMIYSGYINNWKQVGGPDQKILRYTRESNSGTYVFFKEHVLNNRDYAADAQTMPGTSAVAEAVARDAAGIGFGGVAYFATNPKLKILKIARDEKSEPITPLLAGGRINFDVVWSQTYPISRYLYVYSAGQPKGAVKEYLDWILGPRGQEIVEKIEYVPMPGPARAAVPAGN
jgi:phosphate transport system substrate-binding protein